VRPPPCGGSVGFQVGPADAREEEGVAAEKRLPLEQVSGAFRRVARRAQRFQPGGANL
jgi:hypothetical protein